SEIFGGEGLADDRLNVLIHLAVPDLWEELFFMARFERAHDRRHFLVLDLSLVRLPPLADVIEEQHRSVDLDVLALDRCQAVRQLRACALLVSDAEESLIDEPHDRREKAVPIELR